mgnify:CR=1 FL=1
MLLIGLAPLARDPECVTVAGRARAGLTGRVGDASVRDGSSVKRQVDRSSTASSSPSPGENHKILR